MPFFEDLLCIYQKIHTLCCA